MNNEPVAWINIEDGNSILDWEKDKYAQKHYPLYTHPVKELTDKEILEEWDWNSGEILATDLLDFADAILRKAQEK